MSYRLGVDVGGTFTDLLLVDEKTGKLYTAKSKNPIRCLSLVLKKDIIISP